MAKHYLACDLGAESGRVIAGTIAGEKLTLEEIHRFPNTPQRTDGMLRWDFANLLREVKDGLAKAARTGKHFESVSTDSWGVDYALFDARGEVVPPVFHYRDPRTRRGLERVRARVPWETIFSETGIQFMPFNTLYQLAAEDPARLRAASFLLGIGDAINHLLCADSHTTPKIEVSMASTFQLYNPRTKNWSEKLIAALELPRPLFPEIVRSGAVLGDLSAEFGLARTRVVATCSHDTGAAVAGVPATEGSWAYLSSGTWSLLGVELPEPIITNEARELNFTNEIGYGGSVRLLKNLSGLWLVQECRRAWAARGSNLDYATLTEQARNSAPFRSLINPAAEEFLAPENMPSQIADFCRRTGQPAPESDGAFVRCALESLALLYRRTLRQLERLIGRGIDRLHVVGGGSNNDLLNQFTADATGIPVLAGPAEATAAGNILIQALALGDIPNLATARGIVRNSSAIPEFRPRDIAEWKAAAVRFEPLIRPGPLS